MKPSALFLLVPLLGACDVHTKNPADKDENVSIRADESGQIAFNLPVVEGKMKVPGGMMGNGNFDIDGVKLMPGSSVTGFNLDSHGEATTIDLSFKAAASPDEVRSYYLDQFKNQAVRAALAGDAVTGTTKDGSPFTIRVSPAAGGSQGTIQVMDQD